MLGRALRAALVAEGHEPLRLVRRRAAAADEIGWVDDAFDGDAPAVDAVVHLAGDNIAEGRWNEGKKRRIRDSRVAMTDALARALAAAPQPPRAFVGASAIGYYGAKRGDELLTEDSPAGDDFLARVCIDWERAADPLRGAGCRVAHMRIGVVLSPDGGALSKMLLPFRLGLGGPQGSGEQYMSWVTIDDVVRGFAHALRDEDLAGPHNLVAPHAVTNREFAKTLGRVLRRPAFMPLPAFAIRLLFGEMGDALLLSSNRVVPAALSARGFAFEHDTLEGALRHLL